MPYEDPEPTDPMMFVGVGLPGTIEDTREMAYTFAEEFARMGYPEEKIMHLFSTPFYKGAYGTYEALGEDEIRKIVGECVGVWGRVRFVDRDSETEDVELTPSDLIDIEPCG